MAGQLGGRVAARQAGRLAAESAVAALMFTAANGWASQLLVGPTRRPLKAWSKRVSTGVPPQPAGGAADRQAGWQAGCLAVLAERACVMRAACVALTLTHVRGLKITNRLCGCRFFFGVIFFFSLLLTFFFSFFFSFMMKPNYRSIDGGKILKILYRLIFLFLFCFFSRKKITIFFVCLFRLESDLAAEVWWGTADKFIIFWIVESLVVGINVCRGWGWNTGSGGVQALL